MGFWHDLGTPSGWFGGSSKPDPALTAAITSQTDATNAATVAAKAAADASLKAQSDANLIAAAASKPAVDSEGSRSASDAQRRKLLAGSSFGIGLPTALGAPPVGFRLLSGQ